MIVYLSFLFALFSLLGVAFSPDLFSRPFCALEMVLFLIFGGIFLRHKIKRNGLICFDTFFIPTYLLINYVHAVFIYPNDQFLPAFAYATRSEVIPRALAVAQLGIAMYMLASVLFEKNGTVKRDKKIWIPQMAVNRTAYVSVLAGLGVFAFVFLTNRVQGFTHIYPRLMAMIMSLMGLSWYYQAQLLEEGERGLRVLLRRNKLNILATSLFTVSQLYIGGRSEVLLLLFMILLVINTYYMNVKFKVLVPDNNTNAALNQTQLSVFNADRSRTTSRAIHRQIPFGKILNAGKMCVVARQIQRQIRCERRVAHVKRSADGEHHIRDRPSRSGRINDKSGDRDRIAQDLQKRTVRSANDRERKTVIDNVRCLGEW